MTKAQADFVASFREQPLDRIGELRQNMGLECRRLHVPCYGNPCYDALVRATDHLSKREVTELLRSKQKRRVFIAAFLLGYDG